MKIINYIKKHKKIILTNLLIFLSYLTLISVIQLAGIDDLEANTYQYIPKLTLIETIKHIVNRAVNWNTRIGEILYFIVGAFPRWVFLILNSFMMVIYINLMYLYMIGTKKEEHKNKYYFIVSCIYLFTLLFTPVFSEVFLWMGGSCNHLWGTIIILLAAYPFRLYIENKNVFNEKFNTKWKFTLYLIYCFVAGTAMENVVPTVIFACFISILINLIENKKIDIKPIITLITMTIGFLFLIFASSTQTRINLFNKIYASGIPKPNMFSYFYENYKFLIITAIALLTILIILKKIMKQKLSKTLIINISITLISFISFLLMIFSPYFELRTVLIVSIFLIAFIVFCLSELIENKMLLNVGSIIIMIFLIICIQYLIFIYKDFYEFNKYRELSYQNQIKKYNTINYCLSYDNPYNVKDYNRLFDIQKVYCDSTYLKKIYNIELDVNPYYEKIPREQIKSSYNNIKIYQDTN